MKIAVKRLARDEKGHVLTLVLILLVVGGLIIAPLLAFMGTGLIAGQLYERKTDELYAADAGVEDALWQLKQTDPDDTKVPSEVGQTLAYTLGSTVNDKEIEVTIDMIGGTEGGGLYKVTSTATSAGGSNTTIESYVQTFPLFWDHAITSTGDITLQPGSEVHGDVMGNVTGSGTVYGDTADPYDADDWPFDEDFRAFYWPQVEGVKLPFIKQGCKGYVLDVNNYTSFGPGYHDGNPGSLTNFYIENSGGDMITVKLMGTVYIKGDDAQLDITGGNEDFYLDLNYQTIYVEGISYNLSTPTQYALQIGNRAHIIGSGVIIAEGNIDFRPSIDVGSEDEFVFVLSLCGTVHLHPAGTAGMLYGSVAAQEVYLGPGNILTHTDSPTDPETGEQVLSLPGDAVECTVKILTWDINPG